MSFNSIKNQRRSIRLPYFDYSQDGQYFITICSFEKKDIFSRVENNISILNNFGKIVEEELLNTQKIRKNVMIGKYVIMPNHIHVIITITRGRGALQYDFATKNGNRGRGVLQYAPTFDFNYKKIFKSPSQSIGSIVRGFKSITTKRINIIRQTPGVPVWQRNFYEHIIRDENDYHRIVDYIKLNPEKWQFDRNFRK